MKKSAHSLPLIQPHLVRNHCDELAVGWFSAQVMDGIAEVAVEGVHVSPVPCYLDGDVLRLVHGEQNGIPQELVALDVGGDGIRVGNKSKSKSYYLLV